MNKLKIFALSIPDFRMNRKKLHPVENIVIITVLALFSNAKDWEEVADFGHTRKDFFAKYLDLSNGIPSHDTFNRFFSLFDPLKFQTLFIGWIHELLGVENFSGKHIAIDGKSCRGSGTKKNKMIHLLNAYLVDNNCVIGQERTEEKSNEVTAIPNLLDVLDIENALISIDAMGCQTAIAEKIISKKGDYLLAVKQNQKTLYEDIESAFLVFKPTAENLWCTEELNGSRIEKRSCKIMTDMSHLSTAQDWKGLQTIIKIETEVYHKTSQKTTNETRYYISSKSEKPKYFLLSGRNHWGIENNLHWCLDVIMGEDSSRKRNENVTENYSILLKIILSILKEKQKKNKKISIKRMMKMASWSPEYLLELLDL
jgi:predicted transposase YbfD/YdcC